MSDNANLEKVLKRELKIVHGGEEYTFKIPSVKDRLKILGKAVELRQEVGGSVATGYDPNLVISTETLATFLTLVQGSSAKWVYSPGHDNKPVMDLDQWPDNVPVAEVVDQFQKELDTFRAAGN